MVDDHHAVEGGAQDSVLASLAGEERALGALSACDVHHQGDRAEHHAMRVADRADRDADVDQRAVAMQPALIEVAQRLAALHAGEVCDESVDLVLGTRDRHGR